MNIDRLMDLTSGQEMERIDIPHPCDEWLPLPTKKDPITRGQWQKTPWWLRVFFFADNYPHRRRVWIYRDGQPCRRAWEYDDCTIMAKEMLKARFDPDVSRVAAQQAPRGGRVIHVQVL